LKRAAVLVAVALGAGLVALAAVPDTAAAYPIRPQPLRELVEKADAIVVARVRSWDEYDRRDEDDWNTRVAVLHIVDVVKGDALPGPELRIPFPGNLICPEPPRYPPWTTVLAFLVWNPHWGRLETLALSYGTKDVSDPLVRVSYVAAVRRLLDILDLPDEAERAARTVEWLVQCAIDPRLRWEGAYDLAHGPAGEALSVEQRRRLLAAVLSSESLDDPGTVCIVLLLERLRNQRRR